MIWVRLWSMGGGAMIGLLAALDGVSSLLAWCLEVESWALQNLYIHISLLFIC